MVESDSQPGPQIDVVTPAMPEVPAETGLDFGFLADLALKAVYADSNCTSERVAEKLRLPLGLTEPLLQHLYRERLIEILGRTSIQGHRYQMLDRGWERARHVLDVCGYIGPAPVSLGAYSAMTEEMERGRPRAGEEEVRSALAELVLPESAIETLGLAADSRRSLFLTGPSGSGKTSAAKALHSVLHGKIWVPYAIEVDGHVIKVFDRHCHTAVEPPKDFRHDRRWVLTRRPLVVVGGELQLEEMDLIFSRSARFYEAPFQVKSNGGLLLIDDFGRQRVDPHELLNRWIIPLENRVDYLTLHTGKKIEVPFLQLLVFATNLNPNDLVDEAFLRRMGYRLAFSHPSQTVYAQIFVRYAASRGLNVDAGQIGNLLKRYESESRQMKACDPRDLIERCLDICRFEKLTPHLSDDLLDQAWRNYFGV